MKGVKHDSRRPDAPVGPPTWLRLSCLIVGCLVPAMLIAMPLLYLTGTAFELTYGPAVSLHIGAILLFAVATAGVIAVGVSVFVHHNIDAARFMALLGGFGAVLTSVGVAYDWFITPGWTWRQVVIAGVVVYYLVTTCAIHWRFAYLLSRVEPKEVPNRQV